MKKLENINKHQPSCKLHKMPKYYTLHVVKTVHVCPVHLLHCKVYITTFSFLKELSSKLYFLPLPEEP